MKNKIFLLFFFYLLSSNAHSLDQFNFDVTELKILENGDKIIGSDRGIITSNNGVVITANQFEYYKKLNVLYASGNVKIVDKVIEDIGHCENKSLETISDIDDIFFADNEARKKTLEKLEVGF